MKKFLFILIERLQVLPFLSFCEGVGDVGRIESIRIL